METKTKIDKKKIPAGFFPRGKVLYFRFHDPILQTKRSANTGLPVSTDGIRQAPKWKEEFLYKLHRKTAFDNTIPISQAVRLSDGLNKFLHAHSVPESKNYLRPKSQKNHERAVWFFKQAVGDKYIAKYTTNDYNELLYFFDEFKVFRGKDKINWSPLSVNSRSIYTRALSTLWNWFIEQKLANTNIIEAVEFERDDPDPIPFKEMAVILEALKKKVDYPHHYQLIAFLLMTGCRPSSALVQLKENIFMDKGFMKIKNVKAGKRKKDKKEYYNFPIFPELQKLLSDMKVNGTPGRLFDMFSIDGQNYTNSLKFWDRTIATLKDNKEISEQYMLKQIRPTFASYLINALKVPIYTVKDLLDHSNIKITEQHYLSLFMETKRNELVDFALPIIANKKD